MRYNSTWISSEKEQEVIKQAKKIHEYLKNRIITEKIGILLYSPVPAPIDKIKNKYRWRMIIKCIYNEQINTLLHQAIEQNECKKSISQTIEINPSNMM